MYVLLRLSNHKFASDYEMSTRAVIWILTTFAAVSTATACSCVPPGTPYEELQRSDFVFAGRVLAVGTDPAAGAFGRVRVRFQRIRTFGASPDNDSDVVFTGPHEAACGFRFRRGAYYIVYANENDGSYHTSICTRTARLSDAEEDLAAFNALDLLRLEDRAPRCGGPTGIAAIQSALLVVGFVLIGRRRQNSSL